MSPARAHEDSHAFIDRALSISMLIGSVTFISLGILFPILMQEGEFSDPRARWLVGLVARWPPSSSATSRCGSRSQTGTTPSSARHRDPVTGWA